PATGLMLTWNQRVTGSPWKMPYQAHMEQYEVYLPFLFLPPRPEPAYRYKPMRDLLVVLSGEFYRGQQTLAGWSGQAGDKLRLLPRFFLDPLLGVPFLMLPLVLRLRWVWFALGTLVLLLAVLVGVETWTFSHYAAPAAALVYYLLACCVRRLTVCHL